MLMKRKEEKVGLPRVRVTRSGCFEAISRRPNAHGYLQISVGGQTLLAHRYVWEKHFGSIPNDMGVLHRCDNRFCINPEHLFLGMPLDNSRDMTSKNRQSQGEQRPQAKLSIETVREMRRRYIPRDKKNSTYSLAREFGVSQPVAWYAIKSKTWNGLLVS